MNHRIFCYVRVWLLVSGVIVLGLSQSHCLPTPDPREKIQELRVLGIKAEPPAAKPGDTITLSVLSVSPTEEPIALTWFLCTSPQDVEQGCHDKPTALALGTANTATLVVPTNYLQGELTAVEKQEGRYLVVTLVAKSGAQTFVATKRTVISPNPNNQNPQIAGLSLLSADGTPQAEPWSVQPEKKYKLTLKASDGSQEAYIHNNTLGSPESVKEKLYLSWYLTHGSYEKGYLSEANDLMNTWVLPKELPTSGKITLYAILRDNRGGVDWKSYTVRVP